MEAGNGAKRFVQTVFPIRGNAKWRAEPGKLRDDRGAPGCPRASPPASHRPATPSRWPGSAEGRVPVRKALLPLREVQNFPKGQWAHS